ncbi:MAG: PTS sugar transporter subunit IIC, partial [Clostridia bacterium]|nr:PTS sugar transporter subunit IIC [Clostridia bacterium]
MPTSSAAIWVAIATSNTAAENPEVFAIAGGAAVAGCAAHMVGFAVSSYRENGFSGLISQGLGTSMLQIPNIMKKPVIMLPEIIASIFAGLVAVLLNVHCTAAGGGMGTSGLVGLFGIIDSCQLYGVEVWKYVLGIVLCLFVIPAAVSLLSSEIMRKKGWIKYGDMKLPD